MLYLRPRQGTTSLLSPIEQKLPILLQYFSASSAHRIALVVLLAHSEVRDSSVVQSDLKNFRCNILTNKLVKMVQQKFLGSQSDCAIDLLQSIIFRIGSASLALSQAMGQRRTFCHNLLCPARSRHCSSRSLLRQSCR